MNRTDSSFASKQDVAPRFPLLTPYAGSVLPLRARGPDVHFVIFPLRTCFRIYEFSLRLRRVNSLFSVRSTALFIPSVVEIRAKVLSACGVSPRVCFRFRFLDTIAAYSSGHVVTLSLRVRSPVWVPFPSSGSLLEMVFA